MQIQQIVEINQFYVRTKFLNLTQSKTTDNNTNSKKLLYWCISTTVMPFSKLNNSNIKLESIKWIEALKYTRPKISPIMNKEMTSKI